MQLIRFWYSTNDVQTPSYLLANFTPIKYALLSQLNVKWCYPFSAWNIDKLIGKNKYYWNHDAITSNSWSITVSMWLYNSIVNT